MKIYIGPYPKSYKKDRKINIHIDNYDCWDMFTTLAMIILPMLKILKKNKMGAPFTDDEPCVPKKLWRANAPKQKNKWDTDKNWFKRWDWILNEMIWTFTQLNTDLEKQFHSGKIDIKWEETPESKGKPKSEKSYLMKKGPKDTHKFDRRGYEKHNNRIKNGLNLFSKYYMALWD